jgi:hypothetical protein
MALLLRCTTDAEPILRHWVLEQIPGCVQNIAISVEQAFLCLEPLLSDSVEQICTAALDLLAKSWLRILPDHLLQRRDRLIEQALAADSELIARAAIGTSTKLGMRPCLVDRLHSRNSTIFITAELIEALVSLAEAEDLQVVLELAESEPLNFAAAARCFLLEAHRHGIFIREHQLDAVLTLFDAHHLWKAEELIRITYVVRNMLIQKLAELPIDDQRWLRRSELLSSSGTPQAQELLQRLLAEVRHPDIALALIQAAARHPTYSDEMLLLRWLDELPELVLPILCIKGGANSIDRLQVFVREPFCPQNLRRMALTTLWTIVDDRAALLQDLCTVIDYDELGLSDERFFSIRDYRIAQLALQDITNRKAKYLLAPIDQLRWLCNTGEQSFRAQIEELFRSIFCHYVQLALAGDLTIKRLLMPELEHIISSYGQNLLENGRAIRRWLEDRPENGKDLLALMASDWLKQTPEPAISLALLELLGRLQPTGAILRQIEALWRHKNLDIQRAALEALCAVGQDMRGLELSIGKLTASSEPRILTQALAIVGKLETKWAESMAIDALNHPQMAVKKAAAEALAMIGSDAAVDTVVSWLAHHDNPGLRTFLKQALHKASDQAYLACVLRALAPETDPRRRNLLFDALDGQMSLKAVLKIARRPEYRDLIDACLQGSIALADASCAELQANLHRLRLHSPDLAADPTMRLQLEGFSPDVANDLLAMRNPKLEQKLLPLVRLEFASWLSWLKRDLPPNAPQILALLLDSTEHNQAAHFSTLLALITQYSSDIQSIHVFSFFGRCLTDTKTLREHQIQAIEISRQLPTSQQVKGSDRYQLLAQLGAVRSRKDLDLCLAECRCSPNIATQTAQILYQALSIPLHTANEHIEITELRKQANEWHKLSPPEAKQWLDYALQLRPLDLPIHKDIEPIPKLPKTYRSQRDLDLWSDMLHNGDIAQRLQAAQKLLQWDDAQHIWPQILDYYLTDEIDITNCEQLTKLASKLHQWPQDPYCYSKAQRLIPRLSLIQQRRFAPIWINAWLSGESTVEPFLRSLTYDLLFALVARHVQHGEHRLLRLLRNDHSMALRLLVESVAIKAPQEIQHLITQPAELQCQSANSERLSIDPLFGKNLEQLVALIADQDGKIGLAVRAIRALTAFADLAIEHLEQFAVDKRPQIRSAALRTLRKIAPKDRYLQATHQALKIEHRRDIIRQLLASLGHARYQPAIDDILKMLEHRDTNLHKAAENAVIAWGHDLAPQIQYAMRRSRPDRRHLYQSIMAKISNHK